MARPSPAPPASVDVDTVGGIGRRSASARRRGCPGPSRRRSRVARPPSTATLTSTRPPFGAYLQALSSSTPSRRSSHSAGAAMTTGPAGGVHGERQAPRLRDRPEPVDGLLGDHREVHRLVSGWAPAASKRASQSMSSSIRRIRLDSRSTRSNAVRYQATSRSWASARLVCASMTDERRPQLVRRVGGEVELAAAGGLDRRCDAPADATRRGTPRPAGSARSAASADDVRCASLTASIDCADDDPVVAHLAPATPDLRRRRSSPSPGP